MASVNLEKTFEYLKIQEILLQLSLASIYVNKYFFIFFSTLKDIIQAKSKANHWISDNLMIFYFKGTSEESFLFSVNVNASLKQLWALRGHLGTWVLREHLGTWTLVGHSKAIQVRGHLRYSGTWALTAFWHLSNMALRTLRHLGTRALRHLDT